MMSLKEPNGPRPQRLLLPMRKQDLVTVAPTHVPGGASILLGNSRSLPRSPSPDAATGALTIDERFREEGAAEPGGGRLASVPHGAVLSRRSARDRPGTK